MTQEVLKRKLDNLVRSDSTNILQQPAKLFLPHRIVILDILYRFGYADFRQLKTALNASDGNLASHLRALEQDEYVRVEKEIVDRRPRTTYVLTKKGYDACLLLQKNLENVVHSGNHK